MIKIIRALIVALCFVTTSSSFAANYCAAVRGNGELVPAHWASLARIVENMGMPSTVAGGSSASVSMFFMDAISRNQQISDDPELSKLEQSLLLKSIMAHLNYLWNEDSKAPMLMGLVGNISQEKFLGKLKNAAKIATNAHSFFHLVGEYGAILNPSLVQNINRDFSFGKKQLLEAISMLGKFDARNDMALFYREGVVDFKFIALMMGRVADFYAGYTDPTTRSYFKSFIKNCALPAKDLWWSELASNVPYCQKLFDKSLESYYLKKQFANKMIFEKIGSGLSALPTTAIVHGNAISRYQSRLKQYWNQRGENTPDFSLNFNTELSYGYWGKDETLNSIKNKLKRDFSDDTKSQKFLSLGQGSWFEVLSTSPAEPGLANLQRLPDSRSIKPEEIINRSYFKKILGIFPTLRPELWFNEENPQKGIIPFRSGIFSAGGWSDLHPTLVLRASGCEQIVYVTRQGGDSVFAQQIFIRLTGFADKIRFWKDIRSNNRQGWTNLTQEEEDSPWNKLYNLANPNSSYSHSITEANAIFCTNWDNFDLFGGDLAKIELDSWNAPLFSQSTYSFGQDSLGKSNDGFPGCLRSN